VLAEHARWCHHTRTSMAEAPTVDAVHALAEEAAHAADCAESAAWSVDPADPVDPVLLADAERLRLAARNLQAAAAALATLRVWPA
jgi:hypothetical protein